MDGDSGAVVISTGSGTGGDISVTVGSGDTSAEEALPRLDLPHQQLMVVP
jgi:hypothetical protein